MPTWIEVKEEIDSRGNDFDGVRREKIRGVEEITERPLIIYATAFLEQEKAAASRGEVNVDNKDLVAFDEVIENIKGDSLDVLLHSPGGSVEAAESIVILLRSRFSSLRFIVPHMAKSAATMMCCAGDEILMDERSELGPIDPQMLLQRADGVTIRAPAQAILLQFDKAKKSLAENPKEINAWLPILQPLGPSLLIECESANQLAKDLVTAWLGRYMFSGRENPDELAANAAKHLASSKTHQSHARRIGIDQLRDLDMVVADLRDNPELREAIWGLYHAIAWTLQVTGAVKIVENSRGDAYIRSVNVFRVEEPVEPPQPARRSQSRKSKRRRSKRK